jgi:hypothetical protein
LGGGCQVPAALIWWTPCCWPRLLSWWRAVCSLSFWTGGAVGPITAGSESICANSCVARARKADAAGVGSTPGAGPVPYGVRAIAELLPGCSGSPRAALSLLRQFRRTQDAGGGVFFGKARGTADPKPRRASRPAPKPPLGAPAPLSPPGSAGFCWLPIRFGCVGRIEKTTFCTSFTSAG